MNTAAKSSDRKWGLLTLLAFTAYYALYTHAISINVVWQSWFANLKMAEKLYLHTLALRDMLLPYGEHGMLGYNVLALLNVSLFRINTLFDAYLNVGIVCGCGVIMYHACKESFGQERGVFAQIPLLLVCGIMFSAIQQSSGGMDTQIRLGSLFAVMSAYALNRNFIDEQRKFPVLAICLLFLSVNVFGTVYSAALAPGILICIALDWASRKKFDRNYLWVTLSLAAFWALYIYEYGFNPFARKMGSGGGIGGTTLDLLVHPQETLKWFSAFLGSGVLGSTWWYDKVITNPKILLLNGLFVFAVYAYATGVFFRSNMRRKTYMPLMMLGYTFFVVVLVMMGRKELGWKWGLSYWYAVHTKFGIAACVWILGFDLLEKRKDVVAGVTQATGVRWRMAVYGAVFAAFLGLQAASNYLDWRRAPHVKHWFEGIAAYVKEPNGAVIDAKGNTPMRLSTPNTAEALRIMKTYRLNIYRDWTEKTWAIGSTLHSAKLGKGWSGWEGDPKNLRRWMAREAEAYFVVGDAGKMTFTASLPGPWLPNGISLFLNGALFKHYDVTDGNIRIEESDLPRNEVLKVKIVMDRAIVPKAAGLGPDGRELGLLVSNIVLE